MLAFSPDGKRLASGSDDTVKIWDAHQDLNPQTFNVEGTNGAMSSDFKQFASASPGRAGTVADKTVTIWSADSGRSTETLTGYANRIFCLAFSPDGKLLASGDGSGPGPLSRTSNAALVKIWEVKTGLELFTLKGHTGISVLNLAFSPDGKRLVTRGPGLDKSELKIWDVQSGQELTTINVPIEPRGRWTNLVFSPDGKRVASGSGSTIKIYRTQDGAELLSFNDGGVAVAFSPDGKRLASGTAGFKIWDAQTGKELLSSDSSDIIFALAFNSDGKRLASTSSDGTVKLWDAQGGQELITFEYTSSFEGSFDEVQRRSHNVAFSADGHRLASVLWDGTVRIWDATPLPEESPAK